MTTKEIAWAYGNTADFDQFTLIEAFKCYFRAICQRTREEDYVSPSESRRFSTLMLT